MYKNLAIAAVLVLFAAQQSMADSIVIRQSSRLVEAGESGAADQGAPEGGTVIEFFADTDGDILALNFVNIELNGAVLYDNTFGTAGAAPNPAFFASFPSLEADSYITTPGGTSVLGGGLPANGDDTFGDTEDNGPQTNFKFAQLTIPAGAMGTFSGQFDIVGANGVFSQNFIEPLGVPEPTSLILAGLGLIGFVGTRRRS